MEPYLLPNPLGPLQIWEQPREEAKYSIGADVAEGKERDRAAGVRKTVGNYSDQRPDYSAAMVVEIETGMHVASWHGHVSPTDYACCLAALGFYYNTALLVPERNGPGVAVVENLHHQIKYPYIYRSRIFNKFGSSPLSADIGWVTSSATRPLIIARVEEALEGAIAYTRDKMLIREIRSMEVDPMGVPRGIGINKDDRVMAYGLSLQGRYETLTGTVHESTALKAPVKDTFDTDAWAHIKQQHERSRSGFRGPSPRRRLRRPRRGPGKE